MIFSFQNTFQWTTRDVTTSSVRVIQISISNNVMIRFSEGKFDFKNICCFQVNEEYPRTRVLLFLKMKNKQCFILSILWILFLLNSRIILELSLFVKYWPVKVEIDLFFVHKKAKKSDPRLSKKINIILPITHMCKWHKHDNFLRDHRITLFQKFLSINSINFQLQKWKPTK